MNEDLDPAAAEFARRTRALLVRSAEGLSAPTRSRLTRARFAALEQHVPASLAWRRWLPAGAAAAGVLAVLLWIGQRPAELPPAATAGDDLELLADHDAFALAQDQPAQEDKEAAQQADLDYEFYDWAIAAAQEEGGGEVGS